MGAFTIIAHAHRLQKKRKLMQQLKGRTAHAMINEFPLLRRQYWGRHMWARGYFCCSSGNVTDEVIKQYITQQEDADETFRIEGE